MLHTPYSTFMCSTGLCDTEMLATSDCFTQVAAGQGRKNIWAIWGCFVQPIDGAFEMVYYWVYHITVDQLLYDHYTTFINLIYRCFLKRGTPKSSIFIRFSIIKHPFGGTTIYGNLQIHTHTTGSMRSEYRRFTFNPGQLIRLS